MKNFLIIFFVTFSGLSTFAQQAGFWDVTFNANSGIAVPKKKATDASIFVIKPYLNNTYLIGGSFTNYGGYACTGLALLDSNFNYINTLNLTGFNSFSSVSDILIQSDGKLIIGGSFEYPNNRRNLCRIYPDGTLDTTFSIIPNVSSGNVRSIAFQSDSSILAAGSFSDYLIRTDINGIIDPGFDAQLIVMTSFNWVNKILYQTDGKILVCGVVNFNGGGNQNYFGRLNSDGTVDASFNVGTSFNKEPMTMILDTSGLIYVGGRFTLYNGIPALGHIRLHSDGSIDTNYLNNLGTGFYSASPSNIALIDDMELLPDGKLILDGDYQDFNGLTNRFLKLNYDGTIDSTYIDDKKYISNANDILYTNDHKIVLAASATSSFTYIKYPYELYEEFNSIMVLDSLGNPNRNIHYRIGPGNGSTTTASVKSMVDLNNGYIILGGIFTTYNQTEVFGIVKIDYNGNIYTNFNCPYKGIINQLEITPDSNILLGGKFYHENYPGTAIHVAKIHPDGTPDPSFITPSTQNTVNHLAIYPDGKFAVAGDFIEVERYLPNGGVDLSFVTSSPNSVIYDLAIINQNELLVSGNFNNWGTSVRNNVAWLEANGNLSPKTFVNVNNTAAMGEICVDDYNNIIYITGAFGAELYPFDFNANYTPFFSGGSCTYFGNLNVQVDGKLVMSTCPNYNGNIGNGVTRTNNDGSIDLSFDRSAPSQVNYKLKILNQGDILINGSIDTSQYYTSITLHKLHYEIPPIMPYQVTGMVYKDMNSDNIYQSVNDLLLSFVPIDENNITKASTNYSGNYSIYTNDTITLINPSLFYNIPYYNLTPTNQTIDFSSNNLVSNIDFAYQPIPGMNDLELHSTLQNLIRIGEDFILDFNIKNPGTTAITPILNIEKDSLNQVLNSIPAFSSIIANSIQIPIPTINPNDEFHVKLYLQCPSSGYSIGDSVMITSFLSYSGSDQTPINNSDTTITTVVSGYDPNMKEVSESILNYSSISNTTFLDYTIHFQNTGNSYAEDIYIIDTIDSRLNVASIEILSAGADSMNLTINQFNNSILSFNFPDIYLPDSTTDELNSHGFVSFRIHFNTNAISVNSVIENTAYIYFDFNPPIQTNTVSTLLYSPNEISETVSENNSINIYPNPSIDDFNVELKRNLIESIKLYDYTGKLVFEQDFHTQTQFCKITPLLPQGVYFILIIDSTKNSHYIKIIKI